MSVRSLGDVLDGSHLPALDGLRAVAVGVVLLFHFGFQSVPGDLGVSGFFVLSGFLITWLLLREFDATGRISLRKFYARRTLRIFPAYYVFVTLSLIADRFLGVHWDRQLVVAAYGYFVNYFNAFHNHPTTSVAHAWSLAVEEQFYLLWPMTFLLLVRRGRAALVLGLVGLIVAVACWRSWLYLSGAVGSAYVYNAFDARFDNLAVGCLLAVLLQRDAVQLVMRHVAARPWYPFVTVTVLYISRHFMPAGYHYSAGFLVDALLMACLIVQLLQLYESGLWRWLQHPVTRYLGRISYPIYLYHAWGTAVGRRLMPSQTALQLLGATLGAVALASGSYFVVELPFLRLKRWFAVRGGAAPAIT